MRWVLITPFGMPVEPEVNRNFAIVSGPTFACAASAASRRGIERGERRRPVRQRIARDDDFDVGRHDRLDGARILRAIAGEHEPGRQQVDDVAQLAEVGRDQRIGRRDRRIGNADIVRRKPEQRMLEIVAGQDRRSAARPRGCASAARRRCGAPSRASRA